MDETETNTSGACELVLDYVYGELDEAQKRTFEEHLPACARCQREVASFGKVRAAVKRVMPPVEPSGSLGGALHAQLMHAAAQRKPRRGILLAFPRKIIQHPALSAAAMFVIVGGAFALNWSHGKLAMPAPTDEKVALDAPKPMEAPLAPKGGEVAAEPMPASKAKEEAEADNRPIEDKTQLALQTQTGPYAVKRPVAHRGAAATNAATNAVAAPAPKKTAPARMKNIAVDGKLAKYDDTLAAPMGNSKDESARVGGLVGGGAGGGRADVNKEGAKSSAPDVLVPETSTANEKAPSKAHAAGGDQAQYRSAAPAPASAPPPAPPRMTVTSTPPASSTRDSGYFARSQAQTGAPAVQKPAANARNFDLLRKTADELAKTGRCDEAIKLYQELEKSSQYLSPTERVSWVRCLNQRGRQEEAQQRLDELKQEKKLTNAQIQDAERELSDARRKAEAKKAKKAPAPADRAPATESVEQRAEPQQASPPDSTHTKVKGSSPSY